MQHHLIHRKHLSVSDDLNDVAFLVLISVHAHFYPLDVVLRFQIESLDIAHDGLHKAGKEERTIYCLFSISSNVLLQYKYHKGTFYHLLFISFLVEW